MHSQSSGPPKVDTAWLNGVRGIAALIVIFVHFIAGEVEVGFRGYFAEPAEENRYFFQLPPFRIIFADQAMVALFFIVSAYSVSIKPLQLRDYAPRERFLDGLASSVFRRPFRLFAPVIVLETISHIAFYFGLYPWVQLHEYHLQTAWEVALHYLGFILALLHPFTAALPIALNIQVWTIPVEARGSFIVFLLILATSHMSTFGRLLTLAATTWFTIWELDWWLFTFVSGLVICEIRGILDARALDSLNSARFRRASNSIYIRTANWCIFILGFFLLCIPEQPTDNPWVGEYSILGAFDVAHFELFAKISHMWRSLGGVMCIFAMSSSSALQAPFNSSFAQYLGKISFGLYLTHLMVIRLARDELIQLTWWAVGDDNAWGWVGAAAVLTPVIFAVAHVFYLLVDLNSVRLSRWIENKLTKAK
jgi:peptidoglycan/LPS O-acetylase OafA/YrhL